jgi:two-component system chemotaxis response regulator CheY
MQKVRGKMTKTILTVDDSKSIRQVVSFTLQEAGYNVIEACDGQDALQKINGSVLHMVVTDLNMPNLDGIGLIKKLRMDQKHKFVPIIMLTTESQNEKKIEGKTAGATGWIVKPFKPEQLLAVVKKVLG